MFRSSGYDFSHSWSLKHIPVMSVPSGAASKLVPAVAWLCICFQVKMLNSKLEFKFRKILIYGGDFLSTAYGVPASHQQGIGILPGNPPLGRIYFPPYGMPVMNPSISSSAVEQMSPFPGTRTKDNHLSVGDINFIMPNQSSCDMSSQMSRAISCCLGKFQASKESEVQGSTASSPAAERAKGDALPVFPMEPIVQASVQKAQTNEQQSRVIKVVPHNPD
ncbi:hypothetical protein QYF36_001483 [Acer negundo]|nr:hypothetical protein QYF36_001483 [Acer negundo]